MKKHNTTYIILALSLMINSVALITGISWKNGASKFAPPADVEKTFENISPKISQIETIDEAKETATRLISILKSTHELSIDWNNGMLYTVNLLLIICGANLVLTSIVMTKIKKSP